MNIIYSIVTGSIAAFLIFAICFTSYKAGEQDARIAVRDEAYNIVEKAYDELDAELKKLDDDDQIPRTRILYAETVLMGVQAQLIAARLGTE